VTTNLHTLIQSLKAFDAYIKGGKSKFLRRPMKFYKHNLEKLDNDFNVVTINHIKIRQHIESILKSLCMSQEKANTYFAANLSINDFLQKLSREEYIQANYFLEIIDRKTRISITNLVDGGLISAGVIASILSTPLFSGVLAFITGFLESPIGLPILSIVFTVGKATYSIYYTITDKTQTLFNSVRDISFTLLKSIISLIAYSLVLASSIAITPIVASIVIAGLLVLTSVIDSFRELFCLVQELVRKDNILIDGVSSLNMHRSQIRHEMGYQKHRNAAIINFVSAIAFTMITAVSCFVPGGFFVTLGVVAAFALIYGIQYSVLKYNDKIIREELQTKLRLINNQFIDSNENEMTELPSWESQSLSHSSNKPSLSEGKPVLSREPQTAQLGFSTSGLSFFAPSSLSNDDRMDATEQPELESSYSF
jgi:hypothetical protein